MFRVGEDVYTSRETASVTFLSLSVFYIKQISLKRQNRKNAPEIVLFHNKTSCISRTQITSCCFLGLSCETCSAGRIDPVAQRDTFINTPIISPLSLKSDSRSAFGFVHAAACARHHQCLDSIYLPVESKCQRLFGKTEALSAPTHVFLENSAFANLLPG